MQKIKFMRTIKKKIRNIFISLFWIFTLPAEVYLNRNMVWTYCSANGLPEEVPALREEIFLLGKKIFQDNCSVCHIGGTNIIIPEKNLKKNALEANGMNSLNSISYQIINGKNGMPAFGGRLREDEIEILASYVLKQSLTNFVEN